MNAVIIQEAKIFDPKKVPEYIREAVKWNLYLPLISEKERRTRETYESLRFERTRSLEATEINLGEGGVKPGTPVPNYFSDTITDEEFEKIASGANKGVVLYSKTIDYLEPLNILEVSTLRDRLHYKDLPNIRSIQELRSNLQVIATTWPEFDAIISPAVKLGTNNVRIEMFYSSDDAFKEYVEELIKRGFLLNRFNTIE